MDKTKLDEIEDLIINTCKSMPDEEFEQLTVNLLADVCLDSESDGTKAYVFALHEFCKDERARERIKEVTSQSRLLTMGELSVLEYVASRFKSKEDLFVLIVTAFEYGLAQGNLEKEKEAMK